MTHRRYCDEHAQRNVTRETASVIIVCGPAGAGKSTYVREQMELGDLIVDVDALSSALNGQPIYRDKPESLVYALAARDAILTSIERQPYSEGRVWIVTGGARRDYRDAQRDRFAAHVIVIETPADVCIERINADPRRSNTDGAWNSRVQLWWNDYRRSDDDEWLNGATHNMQESKRD